MNFNIRLIIGCSLSMWLMMACDGDFSGLVDSLDSAGDADSDSDSDADSDADPWNGFCQFECLPHCISWGGTIMDGECEEGLRCCDMYGFPGSTDADSDTDSDADSDTDSDADSDADSDSDADMPEWCYDSGETRCNANMLQKCVQGEWADWDDCTIQNSICTVMDGNYRCVDPWNYSDSDTDADTDSDTDYECDGYDKDCYAECWGCGLIEPQCTSAIENCLIDDSCGLYFECLEHECCNIGWGNCLIGDEWDECSEACAIQVEATPQTIAKYDAITECVACDACAVSCGNTGDFDELCGQQSQEPNTPESPCYAEDAEEGETACFSWAGWGGPCTQVVADCQSDPLCQELDQCYWESWSDPNWLQIQQDCEAAAPSNVVEKFWAYRQCIYCDACDVACARDAGSMRCDEYFPTVIE